MFMTWKPKVKLILFTKQGNLMNEIDNEFRKWHPIDSLKGK